MAQRFDLIDRLKARIALLAIGRSTLRNQGAPGMVVAARKYLRKVPLRAFSVTSARRFASVLERHTQALMKRFPRKRKANKNWGAARKALNIFLRDVVYSRLLADHYRLGRVEPWLELPLDSNTYRGLAEDWKGPCEIPRWPRLKNLGRDTSRELQTIAAAIAKSLHTHRVHLDIKYWRKGAIDRLDG